MSIQSEINRINNNVQSTLSTIAETGVSVGTGSDALPAAAAALANEKAPINHTHEASTIGQLPVITASSSDGVTYTATVSWITGLTAGAEFTMLPAMTSTNTAPKINVNGLGDKYIRVRLSTNTSTTVAGHIASWIVANKPVTLRYDGSYWEADVIRPDANTIYGTVAIENGGTGAVTAEAARTNLGAAAAKIGVVTVTASTTLALTHAEQTLRVNSASAVTLTVPTNASVAFPVGTCIVVTGVGAGTVTFTPASGVTLNSKDGKLSIDGQYAAVTLYKSDSDVWELWGALA